MDYLFQMGSPIPGIDPHCHLELRGNPLYFQVPLFSIGCWLQNLLWKNHFNNHQLLLNTGVVKLFLLATPIFVFRNLAILHDVLWPSRCENITQKSLNLGTILSKFSVSKFGDPFLEIDNPQKGRDPQFENRWLNKIWKYFTSSCFYLKYTKPNSDSEYEWI